MTEKGIKYVHGYISDPVRPNKLEIEEIYIPSHNIIFNYEKYGNKKLNVFRSESARNYITNSIEFEWSDEFMESIKTNESRKRLYDEEMSNYIAPTPTNTKDIEISSEFVDMLTKLLDMRERLEIMEKEQHDNALFYLNK